MHQMTVYYAKSTTCIKKDKSRFFIAFRNSKGRITFTFRSVHQTKFYTLVKINKT